MNSLKHRATTVCLIFLLFEASCYTEFEITVPRDTLTGFYGEALILPCTFPVDRSWDLKSTVITWQRGLDVVHSFYYSQDQLDRQNRHYVNRTSLFVQEMARGNASLRLDKVTPQDTGMFTCSVSTNTGSQKKTFGVKIAAFYSEPRLQFSMLTDGVNLLVTSDGGYPSPTLQWLMGTSDITDQTQTRLMQDMETGLFNVSSWMNFTKVTNSSLTFILHNKPLGQDIRRDIQLCSGEAEITVPRDTITGFYAEFEITVPKDPLTGFYGSQDQLDRQNRHYVNRTSLFIQEMARGNASLRLDKVTPQDAGVYTCSVSTNTGSQKKSFGVKIAAFYSEPRLQFSMLTDGVNLLMTSDGGYPSPTLQWLMGNSDITNQTQTYIMQDTQTGLFNVSSLISLPKVTKRFLTFILLNNPAGQEIRKDIQLSSAEFEITVPKDPLTGFYGEALILPCTFPVDSSWDLKSTVITWQRGLDVVHSFYYSQDQLDRQNRHYVNRTSLFIQEMARGNASLRLDKVTPQDAGVYTCSVSTNTGSQKRSFGVKIAAFYSEPRLQFSMLTDGVNLQVTSDGGYPSPTLQWLMENSDITNQTQTHINQDTETGLYVVSSFISLTEVTNSSLTFILHNKPLGQDIRRDIQLYSV
ncbi:CD276 antigen-like protein [Labeo rohita]|uniref:CD276 antigen-like protein n=1 Tax=Labeo rohita TaxID=84645 RepID=A0A498LHT5_LABRO|nr:CD276 antigen-like protein [Labeo rohita]